MATLSLRRQLIDLLISKLITINGAISTEDSAYTYHTNLFNNVFRGLRYIDEINDFPSIYLSTGPETYVYNTVGNTQAFTDIMIRCYVKVEANRDALDDLIEDIDHLISKMRTDQLNIQDIMVLNVDTDQGIIEDYGIAEITVRILYEATTI